MRGPERSEPAFDGSYVHVEIEHWPEGPYEVVRQHGAAAIVALTPDDEVVLVRQFRPPVRDDLVEIPAGLLDVEGEDALTCAERELFEETGYRPTATAFLGGVYVSPGSSDQFVHLFLARTGAAPEGLAEEGIEVLRRPLAEMLAAARGGRIRDAKTALALLMAADRLGPA